MSKPAILSFIYKAFSPPFATLPFFAWLFFFWCFLIHPDSPFMSGALWDSDDYIHFVRAIDWLDGQSWFDPVLYRLAPSEGAAIHFARLAELPLAVFMWPLHAIGLDWRMAGYLTACFYPLLLAIVLFKAVHWAAREILDPSWARISAYVAVCMPYLMFQFGAGRVDHHALAVLATLGALGSLFRLVKQPTRPLWPVSAAFFLMLGVSVALETLVWFLVFSLFVGLLVTFGGRAYAKVGAFFGGALFLFGALFLALSVPPSSYLKLDPLAYSALYVGLAGAVGFVLCFASSLTSLVSRRLAVLGSGLMAFTMGLLFLQAHPSLSSGGLWGAVEKGLSTFLLTNMFEASSKLQVEGNVLRALILMLAPFLGLGVSVRFALKTKEGERLLWGLVALVLTAALSLTLFYQQRYNLYAQCFAVFPLAALLQRGWAHIAETKAGRRRFACELALVLLVGPLLTVIVPALMDGRSFSKGVLLYPLTTAPLSKPMSHSLWFVLNDPGFFGDRQRRIMATLDDGAEILFHTKHFVFAAPYHTNVKGNLLSTRFFQAQNPDEALKIARELNVDLVILPKDIPPFYVNQADQVILDADGKEDLAPTASFAEQLAAGRVPSWLKQVHLLFMGGYRIFEVQQTAKTTGIVSP